MESFNGKVEGILQETYTWVCLAYTLFKKEKMHQKIAPSFKNNENQYWVNTELPLWWHFRNASDDNAAERLVPEIFWTISRYSVPPILSEKGKY